MTGRFGHRPEIVGGRHEAITDPADLAFFYCHVPQGRPATLTVLVTVTGKRWPVEECHQQGKGQTGLDQHQVRLWCSFCRHTVLSMCAQALLAVAAARPAPAPPPGRTRAPAGPAGQPPAWRDTGTLTATPGDRPPGGTDSTSPLAGTLRSPG